jgi:hypothetical protein
MEGNNYYYLMDEKKEALAYAEETSHGYINKVARLLLRHFREFEIVIQDQLHGAMIQVKSPIRFFKVFRAREVDTGLYLGRVEEKASILNRKLAIYDSQHKKIATVKAPRFKYWSFTIKGKREMGKIDKNGPASSANFSLTAMTSSFPIPGIQIHLNIKS